MAPDAHLVYINEFFYPDICASAAVLTEQLPRLMRLRPGLRITVVCGNRGWDNAERIHPIEGVYRGVRIVRVSRPAVSRTSLLRRGLGFAAFGRGVLRAVERLGRIDLVIGTTAPPQGGRIAAQVAARCKCPYVYRVLDLYPDLAATLGRTRRVSPIYLAWRRADRAVLRRAAAVVSVTTPMTQRIARRRRVRSERLFTLHDGFDPARLTADTWDASAAGTSVAPTTGPTRVDAPAADGGSAENDARSTGSTSAVGNEFRRRHNPNDRFLVQYAGNMGLSHPFETIVASAKALAGDNVLFQFIGDGPQRKYLAANLPPSAQLLPYQPAERLGDLLRAADVCLISQHAQMFDQALPYKIYAILAAGRPSIFIGDRRSEVAQWLAESGAGRHLDHGRPDELSAAIRELRDDAGLRARMSDAARSFFAARFHADDVAIRWLEIIDRALAGQA